MTLVNYGMTFIFTVITLQQLFHLYYHESNVTVNEEVKSTEETDTSKLPSANVLNNDENEKASEETRAKDEKGDETQTNEKDKSNNSHVDEKLIEDLPNECDVCDENRIYKVFKNLRDKFSFSTENS